MRERAKMALAVWQNEVVWRKKAKWWVVQSPDDNQETCGWVAIWWRRGWWFLPVCGGVRWAGAVVGLW